MPVTFRLLELCDPQDLRTSMVPGLTVTRRGEVTAARSPGPAPLGPLRGTPDWSRPERGAARGEWTDPKGLKRKAQTDIVVTVTGFG